jgi:hypothetical protein
MSEQKLSDRIMRGVLTILNEATWFSLEAVTNEYNKKYPPSLVGRIVGFKVGEHEIGRALRALIGGEYVKSEPFSFTDVPHDPPLIRYRLTQMGIQYLAALKH